MASADDLRAMLEATHVDARAWAVRCCHGDTEEADDLLQSVYLAILDGRAAFGGRASFRTWLYGVIRLAGVARRRRQWLRRLLLVRRGDELTPRTAQPADDALAAADDARHLDGALRTLSRRQQDVLTLVFYHDLTVEEAAAVMAVPVGTARTHYARGKTRLAAALADLKEG